jgi:hypothetical protein
MKQYLVTLEFGFFTLESVINYMLTRYHFMWTFPFQCPCRPLLTHIPSHKIYSISLEYNISKEDLVVQGSSFYYNLCFSQLEVFKMGDEVSGLPKLLFQYLIYIN